MMPLVQDQRLTAEDMDISQLDEELDFDSQTGVNQPLIAETQPRDEDADISGGERKPHEPISWQAWRGPGEIDPHVELPPPPSREPGRQLANDRQPEGKRERERPSDVNHRKEKDRARQDKPRDRHRDPERERGDKPRERHRDAARERNPERERGDRPRERHRDAERERDPERERGDKPRERHREAERERERVRDRPRDGENSAPTDKRRSRDGENSQPTDKRRSSEADRGRDRDRGRESAKETREMPPSEKRRTSTRDVPTDKVPDREPNSARKSGDNKAPSAGKIVLKKSTSSAKDPLSVRKSSTTKRSTEESTRISDKSRRTSELRPAEKSKALPRLPPPRKRSPPPRRPSPPRRMSPPRRRSPPHGHRSRPSGEDRHGPPVHRSRSPPWARSPPRRPLPLDPWDAAPHRGLRPRSPPPGYGARPHSPPSGYDLPPKYLSADWQSGHRDYPPDYYAHESARYHERRPMSPPRRPLSGDMDLVDHKRARLEEPDRRVQSEWQRLKEYEEELRQKEMMLRVREREAMIAAAGPLPMVNGWAQPDPSRAKLSEPAPWAHGGASSTMARPGLLEPDWTRSSGARMIELMPYPLPPAQPARDLLVRSASQADPPPGGHRQGSERLPRPPSQHGLGGLEQRSSKSRTVERTSSGGPKPARDVSRKAEPSTKPPASSQAKRPAARKEAAETKVQAGTASDAKRDPRIRTDPSARKPGLSGQNRKESDRARLGGGTAAQKASHQQIPASRDKPATTPSAPRGRQRQAAAPPTARDMSQPKDSHPAYREGPQRDHDFPDRMRRPCSDVRRSGPALTPPRPLPALLRPPPESWAIPEWYYRDPQGQIQGPASLHQLKLWLTQLANSADKTRHHVFCQTLVWKHGMTPQDGLPVLQLLDQYR